jgi:thymidylate kinase
MNSALRVEPQLPIVVTFSGIDGAGKSTQIEKLCVRLSDSGFRIERLAFWDNVVPLAPLRAWFSHRFLDSEGGVGAPDKPVRRNDKNVRSWYLNFARCGLYLMDAMRLRRAVAAARSSAAEVVIFDRYIYDQLATLPLELSVTRCWVRFILALVPAPDVAYLLDADPEAARKRKPEYPLEFMRQYRGAYLRLQTIAGLMLVPASSVEEVHDVIVKKFESACGLRVTATALEHMIPSA